MQQAPLKNLWSSSRSNSNPGHPAGLIRNLGPSAGLARAVGPPAGVTQNRGPPAGVTLALVLQQV